MLFGLLGVYNSLLLLILIAGLNWAIRCRFLPEGGSLPETSPVPPHPELLQQGFASIFGLSSSFPTQRSRRARTHTHTHTHTRALPPTPSQNEGMAGKPYRVTNKSGAGPYGVVASNLKELVQEGCKKLQLSEDGCRVCLYEDGTEVDAPYFLALGNNCKLVILQKGQEWKGEKFNILDKFMDIVHDDNDALAELANEQLAEELSPKRRKFLKCLISKSEENIAAENWKDDPKWFEGVDARYKTKSQFMRNNCAARMRNYLPRRFFDPKHSDLDEQMKDACIEFREKITNMLRENKYNESYFDRRDKKNQLCDENGLFTCQGPYNEKFCKHDHLINPYACKEYRIIFRYWNFDHRKEKSDIISDIIKAVKNKETDDAKVLQFYKDLFTMENLKFVYPQCHVLTKHNIA